MGKLQIAGAVIAGAVALTAGVLAGMPHAAQNRPVAGSTSDPGTITRTGQDRPATGRIGAPDTGHGCNVDLVGTAHPPTSCYWPDPDMPAWAMPDGSTFYDNPGNADGHLSAEWEVICPAGWVRSWDTNADGTKWSACM